MGNQHDTPNPHIMTATTTHPVTGRTRSLVIFLDQLIFQLSKHWLLIFNSVAGTLSGLPFLAPVFMAWGLTSWGEALYDLYILSGCHQLPWRSFFFFGAQPAYSYQALVDAVGPEPFLTLWQARRFYGTPALGYKMAWCQRDATIYTTIFLAGLFFALFRRRVKSMPWPLFFLSLVPMGIDGTGQLLGLWESTPLSRVITGGLFGGAAVWLAYPYLDEGMDEIKQTLSARFGWR
jgi:uncharacterized membrane protein